MGDNQGFYQLTEAELRPYNRWDDPNYTGVEDAEYIVEYESQTGPAWDVWALTYPHREADARKYLVHERTHNGVYWYRDMRNDREYGLPEIELVEAHNARLVARQERAENRRGVRKRVFAATGMFLALSVILLPVIPAVAPWLWVASPAFFWLMTKLYGRDPKISYARLAEVRFDEFESDAEVQAREDRKLANQLTIAMVLGYLHLRKHYRRRTKR